MEKLREYYGTRVEDADGKRGVLSIASPEDIERVFLKNKREDPAIRAFLASVEPMDKEWKERIKEFWWGREERETGYNPRYYELRDRLLSFGGESVCFSFGEPDLAPILQYGQFWHGYKAKRKRGKPRRCHENALALHRSLGYGLCTGYALSDDGMWRQHSWCIERRPRTTNIIETTEPRVMYFGFVLDDDYIKRFGRRL